MFQLNKSTTNTENTQVDGKSFLREVYDKLDVLFEGFIDNADEYDSVNEYSYALLAQTWEILEPSLKASYANGVKRGRGGTKKERSSRKPRSFNS